MFLLPAYDPPAISNAGIWHLGRPKSAVHFLARRIKGIPASPTATHSPRAHDARGRLPSMGSLTVGGHRA